VFQDIVPGRAFLRHVEHCHVSLLLVDATAEDPIKDSSMLNQELVKYYGAGQLAQLCLKWLLWTN
jgi:GTPase involved in cell partitioning and DNA repair